MRVTRPQGRSLEVRAGMRTSLSLGPILIMIIKPICLRAAIAQTIIVPPSDN